MNNEPVAWMFQGAFDISTYVSFEKPNPDIYPNPTPLYTHSAKEQELLAEIEGLKKDLKYFTSPCDPLCKPNICDCYKARFAISNRKTLTDEEILTAIKSVADDVGSYKEYENTYEDGWLDACNAVYDEVFAILRKAQDEQQVD